MHRNHNHDQDAIRKGIHVHGIQQGMARGSGFLGQTGLSHRFLILMMNLAGLDADLDSLFTAG